MCPYVYNKSYVILTQYILLVDVAYANWIENNVYLHEKQNQMVYDIGMQILHQNFKGNILL